jgi:AraC-like DNA-binding protein
MSPRPRHAPTGISAAYGRALLSRFGASGPARAALLQGTGLNDASLAAGGSEITLAALLAMVSNVTRAHGEDWALAAAQVWSNAMQGALDVAARSAATLDDALAVLARYGHVRAPYLSVRLVSTRASRRLLLDEAASMDEAAWRSIGYAVALSVHAMLSQIAEGAIEEARISFPWAAPRFSTQLQSVLGCRIEYNADRFVIAIPGSLCGRASPFADPALHASAIAELEHAARRMDGVGTIVGDVSRLVAGRLPSRLAEADAARLLGLSRRSLVRRLAHAGVSYRSLLDEILRERARALLARSDMTRDDMAGALGYSDPTSFSRACRRWFPDEPT